MARSPCSGGSGRRSRSYWMCSCGEWNWDWRTSCLGCGHAAPPWATGAPPPKARPKADKDGWVDQPRGRRAQRQARGAASRAASTKSQTSASAASGTPSGGGATAIERLQAAVEQLEALQAEPPDGVDGCFTDVVASQLEAKRAELVKAQKVAAEQEASSMPRATRLHREANAISKGEKRLRAARLELEQKQEARDLVEAQLHQAQEKLAELDEELEKLPEAWSTINFEVAWAAIRAQMEAVRAQLEGAPLASKRTPWAESCPMEEISSNVGGLADCGGVWQPQPAAERGQAERRGKALGEWPTVAQACKRELAAEAADLAPLAAHPAGKVVESGWAGLRGMGALVSPWDQERAAGPSGVRILLSTGENVIGGTEFGASEWIEPVGRAGVPEPPEAMARRAGPQLPTVQPLRARAQRREEAAARGGAAATGVSHTSAVRDAAQAQWIGNWHLESERHAVMDRGGTSNPMFLEPRPWPGAEENATQRRARGGGGGELDSERHVNGWAARSGGPLPAEGNNLVTSAAASEALQAGEVRGGGAPAARARLEDSRSTGGSAAALSATAVAFSALGHVPSYACAGEGEDTQEIVACTKRGAYKVLGGHAGGRSRLKMQCPGPSNLTNKSRGQRSLRERGPHPGGRPREDRQRARAEGTPALRSHGPVPGHAQERYLEWAGMEAEPAVQFESVLPAFSARRRSPAACAAVAMARSPCSGGSGRRSRSYWMCSCGEWNWDWRTSCLGCGHAAPPWATGAPPPKAWPKADKDGWADQPRGRRAQRQARGAASRAAPTKSQTSGSATSGTPSGGGATAIERLQAAVEQLEALQAEPPDGVDGCFTDVVASQLEAKRAELVKAQKAAAEQKASPMPRATRLHREANAISKGEKRLRAARLELEQKQEARDLVEAQLHQAQEKLAELDEEVEEASLALQALEEAAREEAGAMRRQRAAEWTGASQVPGPLMQLEKLPEAWSTINFEVAWAAIRAQMEAVRAQLEGAPLASKRTPWAESCPMEEISSNVGGLADCGGVWQPQPAAERGQAERRGKALGEWPTVAQACKRELAAEAADLAPLAAHPAGKGHSQGQRVHSEACAAVLCLRGNSTEVVESGWAGLRGMGALVPPWGQERAAGPSGTRILLSTGENVVGGIEFGAGGWIEPVGRAGVPEPPEAMAKRAGPQLPTVQPLRARAQRREEAAARGGAAATGVSRTSAVRDVAQAQWIGNWHLESERYAVVDLGGTSNPMFLEPRPRPGVEENATQRRARGGGDGELDSERYVNGWAASSGGVLPAEGNNLVTSAAASEALQDSRSTGGSAAALSATAVAFSVLGHVLSHACADEGEDAREIAACTKCGAYKELGGHAGGRSRLKMQCPGPSNMTNKSRDQRSLWERGPHPGGRPRRGRQRARAEGIPALRSHGPVPGHAQERCLEWAGMEAEPTGGASTAASSSGSGPTAPAAGRYVVESAAASLPQQRPGPRAGPLGAGGAVAGEPAAAEPAPSDGLVGRRVCRRLARRGSESSGSE
ncbi:unnamed protein product [Prorocentrum cordatum]|uniref:RanBP2-type domain-containing protein n=1 Tax=Prorocentrum cordatum TaxID=2364126 RepID=A0ABN9SHF2_9DINO|nr:unnamed protein product [Polarella glacialis]